MFRLLQMCRIDEKIALLYKVISGPFSQVTSMLYPRVMPITDIDEMSNEMPWGYIDEASN
jgi:hypothetical protein